MRFFYTVGPVDAELHYQIPPLTRLDLDSLLMLIRQRKHFVLHARLVEMVGNTGSVIAGATNSERPTPQLSSVALA